jgi:glycosyltransferase involved in cell wall biosynthesis
MSTGGPGLPARTTPLRVLYVNHTAEVSGAEHSLLDLIGALPATVEPLLATPEGRLADEARARGIATTRIAATVASLKLHPTRTPRALTEIARAAAEIPLAARRHRADLVHANSVRAGVALGLSRPRMATVVHVRDCLPPGRVSAGTMGLVARTATTVVANSQYTGDSVLRLAPNAGLEIVHNPVDLARWDPARTDRVHARARLHEVRPRALLLGVVAQLTPWKGQDTAVEALGLLRQRGIDAHLLLIGSAKFLSPSSRFDNEAYVAELRQRIAAAGLEERVSWLGERDDVPQLISALDALLLPSWEEPFGRALIEAMALRVPVVATAVGGPPEILDDGCEGFLVAPREPAAWAEAIGRFAEDSTLARRMGEAGRRRVERYFSLDQHVAAMLDVYEHALELRSGMERR